MKKTITFSNPKNENEDDQVVCADYDSGEVKEQRITFANTTKKKEFEVPVQEGFVDLSNVEE